MPDYLSFILRLLVFATIHSLLAAPRVKARLRAAAGSDLPWYRLAYNVTALCLFGWVMLAWQSTSVLYLAPGIWSLVMYGLQVLLLLGMLACIRQTGLARFLGASPGGDDHSVLNTKGCHAMVRHPLYLLGILFFLLNPVMTTRWLTLTILGTIYLLIGALVEERRMLALFGTAYRVYLRQTPFILPRLSPGRPRSE